MSRRRPQLVPWRTAGRVSESQKSADDVVREIGWVFNNETGETLDLAEFTNTGDHEIFAYLEAFQLRTDDLPKQTIVEIGSGIGRMTAGFSRAFAQVIACDLDAAFLERCRQTVAQFGEVSRLRTCHVADGRTLAISDGEADIAFSYITLQHCQHDDALSLVTEAARVTKPGGHIALNSFLGAQPAASVKVRNRPTTSCAKSVGSSITKLARRLILPSSPTLVTTRFSLISKHFNFAPTICPSRPSSRSAQALAA